MDRCRLLVHLVDVSGSEGRDPVEDFDAICAELQRYSPELAQRPQIVVANKCDLLQEEAPRERLREHANALGYPLFSISAATHAGVDALVKEIAAQLTHLPPVKVYEPEHVSRPPRPDTVDDLSIEMQDGVWYVEGPWLQKLMANVNFGDYESRNFFDRTLRNAGLFDRLENMGVEDGDTVNLYGLEFEYRK